MNIYKISQDDVNGMDTFDSAVVVANSEEQAKTIHPSSSYNYITLKREIKFIPIPNLHESQKDWTNDPSKVVVEYIGKAANKYIEPAVICASFNAG